MKISQICISRPVFTSVIALILIVIGVIAFLEMPVRFAPFYFKPALTVTVATPGASAEYVEQNIITPLEQSLTSTPGLDMMTSSASAGYATIMLSFQKLSAQDFGTAEAQVLQEVDGTVLPELAERPQVIQGSGGGEVMLLGISDDKMPQTELSNYVSNYLIPQLSQISGVADVIPYSVPPVLRITLNPQKMAAMSISVNDIQNAISDGNASIPLGTVLTNVQAIQLNSQMTLSDVSEFQNLVIAKRGERLVYLKDIADVAVGDKILNHYYAYSNGKPGVAIEIDQSNQANPIELGQKIKHLISRMQPNLPNGLQITPVFDLSVPLQNAVNEVYATIFIAVMLVIVTIFIFLGNWRITLIPVVTIPICLIANFGIMLIFGFTINVITLLALVLAVGLVVDDAIVVLENTYRHIESGKPIFRAARDSISEISFAILGITVCLIAVYLPAIFLPDSIDTTYFQEFSFSLSGAILISGFLALTLTPMMCSRLLKNQANTKYDEKLNKINISLRFYYEVALTWVFKHPKTIMGILIVNLILGLTFFILLPSDLLPPSEINYIQGSINGPNSANAQYLDSAIKPFRQQLETTPELKNVLMYVNGGGGNIFFMAQVKEGGDRNSIVNNLNTQISKMPNFSGGAMVVNVNNINSTHSGSLFFYITGLASYKEIADAAAKMVKTLHGDSKVAMVMNNVIFSKQEYNLVINRNLARMLNIDLGVLNATLATFLGGYTFPNTTYQVNGYGYNIIMQLSRGDLHDLSILQSLYVSNDSKQLIPASHVISVTSNITLPALTHVNGLRAGEIDITPTFRYSNSDLVSDVESKASRILPENLEITWGGNARDYIQNVSSGNAFIILGLVFIYLVLAALFESFIDPLIILCTVPLCVVAGLIGLKLVGGSINIYTKIALVTLVGLVSKHGVLITQFANQLHSEGLDIREAISKAALIRLRPILMTTLTMVLGAIPLVFAVGTDAAGRSQIGAIIVFGLLLGSFFSLFVVPVAYLLLGKFKKRNKF